MTVKIKFFALGKDLVGQSELEKQVDPGTTIESLLNELKKEYPQLERLKSFMVARNMVYSDLQTEINEGDEIAIIPPVSGG